MTTLSKGKHKGDGEMINATWIKPESEYCGHTGIVYSSDEVANAQKSYIFESDDDSVEFALWSDDKDFVAGNITVIRTTTGAQWATVAMKDFIALLAQNANRDIKRYLGNMLGGYDYVHDGFKYRIQINE